jgi:electron transfer flavoprotein beta subunit
MQLKEGGAIDGRRGRRRHHGPGVCRARARKAVSLGADRAVQLTDDALGGLDVNGTGYALAQALAPSAGPRAARASSPTTASATRSAPSWPTTCRCRR